MPASAALAVPRPVTIPRTPCRLMRIADTGDEPAEFQHWVEREKLDRVLPFPAGNRDRDGIGLRVSSSSVLEIMEAW